MALKADPFCSENSGQFLPFHFLAVLPQNAKHCKTCSADSIEFFEFHMIYCYEILGSEVRIFLW